MKLSILIPTYNRAPFLLKNLEMLAGYIRKGTFQKEIEIVVSNNKSTDSTDEKVIQFQNQNTDIQLQYFIQDENIGLEKNALFVLRQAKGEYVMYLGDDDFIDYDYLVECLNYVNEYNLHCIIPSNRPINVNGIEMPGGRDINLPAKIFNAGFYNCFVNSYRGHQLSGLVFKRKDLYQTYINRNVNNIYPFIFFVSYSSLYGKTLHLTKYPVKITAASQDNKDWNYGDDGLLNEIFDNYKKLPITNWNKTKLQTRHFQLQRGRFWNYRNQGYLKLVRAFFKIWFSKNSTIVFKLIFPFIVFSQIIKSKLSNLTK